ncbi:MAG: WYL domain-containing transcriptional regulator [Isosphaeraceae bacterium]|nr:WYL domain-containing transcriptional regulator [Isosphaeraceae bacterium]
MRTAMRFPLERLAALDRAIRAGQFPNAATLARALEVSARTVQRDIEFLRTRMKAPLVFDARCNGYTYADPDYQLPLLNLTEGELVALFLAERVLQQYRGTPYAADLARAFTKLTAGLTGSVTVDLRHLGMVHSFRTTAPGPLDPALFRTLVTAALERRRVMLTYWTAARETVTQRAVDPYHLASVDGQWYLIGHCHLRGEVRMFVPARIRALEPTEVTFEPPADFRIEDYLARSFTVLRGGDGELHRVRLRFTGEAVKYVRERIWHPSQTTEETAAGDLIVSLEVSHLREVERWALSWGRDCTILEPQALRDRVARHLAEAAARYVPSTNP